MPAVAPPAEVAPDPDEATRISREAFAEGRGSVDAVVEWQRDRERLAEKRRTAEQTALDAGGWDGDPENGYTRTLGGGDVDWRQKVFREGDGWVLREMRTAAGAGAVSWYLAGYTLTATLDIAEERRGGAPVAS